MTALRRITKRRLLKLSALLGFVLVAGGNGFLSSSSPLSLADKANALFGISTAHADVPPPPGGGEGGGKFGGGGQGGCEGGCDQGGDEEHGSIGCCATSGLGCEASGPGIGADSGGDAGGGDAGGATCGGF